MPKLKAQGAISRSQLVIAWHLLSGPAAEYEDLGTGYYGQRDRARRHIHAHVRATERRGCKVTLQPIDPATGEILPAAS
jgi:hypothetical protein